MTRRLLEQLLVCRLAESVSFSGRFYSDERTPNPAFSHALHSLLFLLRKPEELRAALSCVYCSVLLEGDGGSYLQDHQDKGKGKDKKGAPGAKVDKDKDMAGGEYAAADIDAGDGCHCVGVILAVVLDSTTTVLGEATVPTGATATTVVEPREAALSRVNGRRGGLGLPDGAADRGVGDHARLLVRRLGDGVREVLLLVVPQPLGEVIDVVEAGLDPSLSKS